MNGMSLKWLDTRFNLLSEMWQSCQKLHQHFRCWCSHFQMHRGFSNRLYTPTVPDQGDTHTPQAHYTHTCYPCPSCRLWGESNDLSPRREKTRIKPCYSCTAKTQNTGLPCALFNSIWPTWWTELTTCRQCAVTKSRHKMSERMLGL